MKKRKYSVIVFDLGNVLIPFDYNIAIEKMEKIEKKLGHNFMELYNSNYDFHRSFERGEVSKDDFIIKMLEFAEHKIDEKTFCEYYSKIFKVNEDVAALLPVLKEKYQLVLLSNTNSIHQEYGWKDYSFLGNFDKLILSHEAGAVKPEPEIYKAVEAFTQKPSEEHIFIDDILEYAEGAKKLGWDAIQFKGYDDLLQELKLREIL
jgi:glucose-1-phosphatase